MCTAVEIMMKSARSTMSDVSTDLKTHSKEQCRTQHKLSAVVALALLLRLLRKSDTQNGAQVRGIAATVRRTFFDSQVERCGQRRTVKVACEEMSMRLVV